MGEGKAVGGGGGLRILASNLALEKVGFEWDIEMPCGTHSL
jgi:hypothetical protein